MVERYAHLSQEHKSKAVELLSECSTSLITTPAEKASVAESFNLKIVNKMGR
jgi:hypothetical protein